MSEAPDAVPADDGAARRANGLARAAQGRHLQMARLQLAFLESLLASPDHAGTIEDATAAERMGAAYSDGGMWVGAAVAELADFGIIRQFRDGAGRLAVMRSRRPTRHKAPVFVWRLFDAAAARDHCGTLRALLARLPQEPQQAELFPGTE